MTWILQDTHDAPQCGIEEIEFETFADMIDYLEDHEDVYKRITTGYANYYSDEFSQKERR